MHKKRRNPKNTHTPPSFRPLRSVEDALEAIHGMDTDSDGETGDIAQKIFSEIDKLGSSHRTSLSPTLPPIEFPHILGFNPVVMSLGEERNRLDTGSFAQAYIEPLDGWSRYTVEVLRATLRPLHDKSPDPKIARAPEALSRVRQVFLDAVNLVDSFAKKVEASIRHPCPASCKSFAPPPKPAVAHASVATDPPAASPLAPTQVCPGSQAPDSRPRGSARTPTPSYARAVQPSQPAAPTAPATKPASLPAKPKSPPVPISGPVRLVVRFGGSPPQDLRSGPQTELFRRISLALDVHPIIKNVSILGAHWNKSGNIIVSFPTGTPEATALALRPTIRLALGIPETVEISIDKAWSKLMVSSVPARPSSGAPVYSHQDLAESFNRNPAVRDLVITRQPRWIRNPDNITGNHSLFVFCFEDPDGSTLRQLKLTSLFMFGAPVTVKYWKEKARVPKPRQAPGSRRRGPAATTRVASQAMEME